MKFEVERRISASSFGRDLAVGLEKGAEERTHGKEIRDARKSITIFLDKCAPTGSVPPQKDFGCNHTFYYNTYAIIMVWTNKKSK